MVVPATATIGNLPQWSEAFFGSRFTGSNRGSSRALTRRDSSECGVPSFTRRSFRWSICSHARRFGRLMPKSPTLRVKHWMLRDRINIVVVGCGGTGAAITSGPPYLHHAMLAAGHPYGIPVGVRRRWPARYGNELRPPALLNERGRPLQNAGAGEPAQHFLGTRLVRASGARSVRTRCS